MRIIGVEGAIVLIEGMLKAGVASESIIILVRDSGSRDRRMQGKVLKIIRDTIVCGHQPVIVTV